ncbi:peptidylprolyl isomerase [Sphingomonas japonica]|uniref:peptidylprolyl isomerase n=1 Tax=Sphingomonas japonica TaxID=511662 RepID=A0ABX0U3P1_9SPHN|nr:peptidylprolyl isomerase [Sphingomonas japonica]NIJ25104.1 peptidyl-prolyl cis-trans isomerase A (cyclophilin A) [Sphingomonas japonica]
MRSIVAVLAALFAAPVAAQDAPPTSLPRVAIETTAGTMTVEVNTDKAPITGKNFLRYVDEKKLDGVTFYRVVKVQPEFGFVQFGALGDPKKTLPPIAHEPTSATGLSHTDGVLSVARLEAGSARGEFTIMVGDNSYGMDAGNAPADKLGYAAFARIVEGRDVLVKILDTPIDPTKATQGAFKGEMPAAPVKVVRARRVGED